MRKFYLLILVLIFMIQSGCRLPLVSGEKGENQIYFSSFESPRDTTGWYGNGYFALDDRAAPAGGSHSLQVAGACIIPHARYFLGRTEEDVYMSLRFWGRNLELGGMVSIEISGENPVEQGVQVNDTVWAAYGLADPLYVPRNSDVYINLNSGGIVYSAMLIDLLRVTARTAE